jgi:hypothetical protein
MNGFNDKENMELAMNVDDAIYHAVHDYEGGPASLAPRMKLAAPTLQSMANPRITTHGWQLRQFRQLLTFTNDMRPLHALCEENGGVFIQTSRPAEASLPELYRAVHNCARELGDITREIDTALADGKIVPREAQRIEQQVFELIEAATALSRRVALDAQPVSLAVAK